MSQTASTIQSRLANSVAAGSRVALFAVEQNGDETVNTHMCGVVVGAGNGQVTLAGSKDPMAVRRTFWLDTIVAVDPVPAVNPRPKQ